MSGGEYFIGKSFLSVAVLVQLISVIVLTYPLCNSQTKLFVDEIPLSSLHFISQALHLSEKLSVFLVRGVALAANNGDLGQCVDSLYSNGVGRSEGLKHLLHIFDTGRVGFADWKSRVDGNKHSFAHASS